MTKIEFHLHYTYLTLNDLDQIKLPEQIQWLLDQGYTSDPEHLPDLDDPLACTVTFKYQFDLSEEVITYLLMRWPGNIQTVNLHDDK